MKRILGALVLLVGMGWYFSNGKSDRSAQEYLKVEPVLEAESPENTPVMPFKRARIPPRQNRRLLVQAMEREREDFEQLDSVNQWLVSKKYRATRRRVEGTTGPRIGRYFIVEGAAEGSLVVYQKKNNRMGVLTGSLMVTANSPKDADRLLDEWAQDGEFEVGATFLPIGVVELKIDEWDSLSEVVTSLEQQDGVKRVTIDVVRNR